MAPFGSKYLRGAALGFAAASLWASWGVVTRLAVTTDLSAWDIVALRFGVAGLLLGPIVMRRGLALDRLDWLGLSGIIAGNGAPYALVAAEGLHFAPAYDGGALNPGCMPLFVALLAAILLHERLSRTRMFGLILILAGALVMIGSHSGIGGTSWSAWRILGDALFLLASFLSAIFPVLTRRARLDPIHAVALLSAGSMLIWVPIYLPNSTGHLAQIPVADLALQALFQGVVITIVSLVLYLRSVAILGAAGGAAFGALVPALTAFIAIPLVGEWPSATGWVSIAVISAGVYLVSGAPLPSRQQPPIDWGQG